MKGDHLVGCYDGKKYLDVHDSTFPEAGTIGLWSKADARSQFDELTLKGIDDDDDDKLGAKRSSENRQVFPDSIRSIIFTKERRE
jgi:hypothetical protein